MTNLPCTRYAWLELAMGRVRGRQASWLWGGPAVGMTNWGCTAINLVWASWAQAFAWLKPLVYVHTYHVLRLVTNSVSHTIHYCHFQHEGSLAEAKQACNQNNSECESINKCVMILARWCPGMELKSSIAGFTWTFAQQVKNLCTSKASPLPVRSDWQIECLSLLARPRTGGKAKRGIAGVVGGEVDLVLSCPRRACGPFCWCSLVRLSRDTLRFLERWLWICLIIVSFV